MEKGEMGWTYSLHGERNPYNIAVEKSYEMKSLLRRCFRGVKSCFLQEVLENNNVLYREAVNLASSEYRLLVRLLRTL
jgi:hypothetical protein